MNREFKIGDKVKATESGYECNGIITVIRDSRGSYRVQPDKPYPWTNPDGCRWYGASNLVLIGECFFISGNKASRRRAILDRLTLD